MLFACFAGAWLLPPLTGWPESAPLLVTLGPLTLVNAPFDWVAIGLTRYVLRNGVACGGPWPCALAIVDALLAVVSVTMLAFVAMVAVQTFGDIAVLRGGQDVGVVALGPLFEELYIRPDDYENWWL